MPSCGCSGCKVPVLHSLLALPKERKFGWKFWPRGRFGLRGLLGPGKACVQTPQSPRVMGCAEILGSE